MRPNRFAPRASHKYGAKRVEVDGHKFPSKLEAAVYLMLKQLKLAGEIDILSLQDRVFLTAARIEVRSDFKIFDHKLGCEVWVEAKGQETDVWRIKRRLWLAEGPGLMRIYKGSPKRIRLHEELVPCSSPKPNS